MTISDNLQYFTGKNIYDNEVSGRLKIYDERYFIENEYGEFEVKKESICKYGEKETVWSKCL